MAGSSPIENEALYQRCLHNVLCRFSRERHEDARSIFVVGWKLAEQLASTEGTWTSDSWRQHLRLMISWQVKDPVKDADLVMAVVKELAK